MVKQETVVSNTTTTYTISAEEIRQAFNLPANATVFVKVPSGGNWSGDNLEIGVDTNLQAETTSVEVRKLP